MVVVGSKSIDVSQEFPACPGGSEDSPGTRLPCHGVKTEQESKHPEVQLSVITNGKEKNRHAKRKTSQGRTRDEIAREEKKGRELEHRANAAREKAEKKLNRMRKMMDQSETKRLVVEGRLPKEVTVTGCEPSVTGTYLRVGNYSDAPRFVRSGKWNGIKTCFQIILRGKRNSDFKHWWITTYGPLGADSVGETFYRSKHVARKDTFLPPRSGWLNIHGEYSPQFDFFYAESDP